MRSLEKDVENSHGTINQEEAVLYYRAKYGSYVAIEHVS
jgi:hypothetical protein